MFWRLSAGLTGVFLGTIPPGGKLFEGGLRAPLHEKSSLKKYTIIINSLKNICCNTAPYKVRPPLRQVETLVALNACATKQKYQTLMFYVVFCVVYFCSSTPDSIFFMKAKHTTRAGSNPG